MPFPPFDAYADAIAYLSGRIDYERAAAERMTTRDFKLDRMRELLARLGDPQETIPAVHVAGTKGKGSTAAMTAEILTAAGYRTGLFTSPHIAAFEERMRVDGASPSRETCVELLNEVAAAVLTMDVQGPALQPTYFEIATAMAWLYFRRQRCDFVVLEVGLGGRLDSTNLCRPEVTVITNVSLDHTNVLGHTVPEIAREKAGVIKPHVPVISGATDPAARDIVRAVAEFNEADRLQQDETIDFEYHRTGARDPRSGSRVDGSALMIDGQRDRLDRPSPITHRPDHHSPLATHQSPATVDVELPRARYDAVPLMLVGSHQAANAALAIAAADLLDRRGYHVPPQAVYAGMANVRWPLRFEVIGEEPIFVIDAAHNAASAEALANTVAAEFGDRRKTLVFAVSREKEVERIAESLFPRFDRIVLTRFLGNPRAVSPRELMYRTRGLCRGSVVTAENPASAIARARRETSEGEIVCATGSFYLAAEVRDVLLEPDALEARVFSGAVARR